MTHHFLLHGLFRPVNPEKKSEALEHDTPALCSYSGYNHGQVYLLNQDIKTLLLVSVAEHFGLLLIQQRIPKTGFCTIAHNSAFVCNYITMTFISKVIV